MNPVRPFGLLRDVRNEIFNGIYRIGYNMDKRYLESRLKGGLTG